MNDADKKSWGKIIKNLREIEAALANNCSFECYISIVGFTYKKGIMYYEPEFQENKLKLQSFINDIANWADDHIKIYGEIAVLGL